MGPSFLLWLWLRLLAVFGEEIKRAACVRGRPFDFGGGGWVIYGLSSNLVGRIFFYSSARMFFYYICAACNFFRPTSACRKFFFKITHPPPPPSRVKWSAPNASVLLGGVVWRIFVWHFISTDHVRQFFPLILVDFIVVV